jgi:PD-(D/E)XK nuclease superfamily
MARNCLASPTVQRAIASGSLHREIPFTTPMNDNGFAVGRVDLLFRQGYELVIVDYKTDRVTEAQVGERMDVYRNQAAAYVSGILRSTGLSVNEVVFVFGRPGIERSVVPDPGFGLPLRSSERPGARGFPEVAPMSTRSCQNGPWKVRL